MTKLPSAISVCRVFVLPSVLALSAAAADPPTRPAGVTPEQMLARLQETYPHCKLHDPQTQRRDFIVHPDFEVSLFASSPWVINPIAMAWDPAGRLWVINSPIAARSSPIASTSPPASSWGMAACMSPTSLICCF
jgi:hypothetical protein